MLIDHVLMRWRVALVLLGFAACTKPNPRSCLDGTCTDPALPFCDLNGEIEGQNDTCIAVACEPGTFEACRGDLAITCNAAGTDFDLIQCERGCDDLIGCRLCEPNETACTNGTVATCDAAGAIVASEPCPLGCFESEPRCREIAPSNGLAAFLDTVTNPPDLDVENVAFDATTGTVRLPNQETLVVPAFLVTGVDGNPSVRVYVVGSLRLTGQLTAIGPNAIAILARSDIQIEPGARVIVGRVALDLPGCRGGLSEVDPNEPSIIPGTGGGGFASVGGDGGDVTNFGVGGSGGGISGTPQLVPLRGGCASGSSRDVGSTIDPGPGTKGGGALQLVSRTKIDIRGVLDADGESGTCEQVTNDGSGCFGGGAGGGILLEAPEVNLGDNAALLARGGSGGGFAPFQATADDAPFIPGPTCAGVFCPVGGNGAGVGTPAGAGESVTRSTTAASSGGGGGGGLGRIRINTDTAGFSNMGAHVAGSATFGDVATR